MIILTGQLAELIIWISVIRIVMSYPSLSERNRPRVVSVIGRLRLLAGILVTGYGLFLASSTSGYLEYMGESMSDYASQEELVFFAGFVGSLFVVEGIIGIIIALGILHGRKWAWTANVVFSSILLLLFALDLAVRETRSAVGLIFNAVLLAYMFTRPVKIYFGRTNPPIMPTNTNAAIT